MLCIPAWVTLLTIAGLSRTKYKENSEMMTRETADAPKSCFNAKRLENADTYLRFFLKKNKPYASVGR
ncbi:hypothetical protein BVG97_07600 [Serratia marcescens]|uniref:Uncharacterized protein n=1 Tax=Serratia marcescens TaxID=615 RepID=A0AAP8PK39_SERMA|nr:hypothetical protein RN42_17060 [Serratia marcescens]PJI68087.1 hypothetical protein CUN64_11420 [Serratia sp. TKO39]RNW10244.1 hypothetical protein CAG37_012335 [Serratia nematodiphila]AQT62861.1 hypothetical protein B0W01_01795 [Serratia marcescens]ASL87451.1 hypothetical protein BVG97_07600 [Serratia marcescens]